MLLSKIMSKPAQCISSNVSILEAAIKMKAIDSGFLPVCEDENLVGVITDRDIVLRGVATGKDMNQTSVKDIITREPVYCFENDHLLDVLDKMEEYHVRRLVVMNENKNIVGVLSIDDIAAKGEGRFIPGETLERVNEKIKRILYKHNPQ